MEGEGYSTDGILEDGNTDNFRETHQFVRPGDEFPYKADVYVCENNECGCGRIFNGKFAAANLGRHVIVITAQAQPIQCNICGIKFHRGENLHRHVKFRHIGGICSHCGGIPNHVGEKKAQTTECEICGLNFRRGENLHKHVKVEHIGGICSHCGQIPDQGQAPARNRKETEAHADQEEPCQAEQDLGEIIDANFTRALEELEESANVPIKETPKSRYEQVIEKSRDFGAPSDSGYASGIVVSAAKTQPQQQPQRLCDFPKLGKSKRDDDQRPSTPNMPITQPDSVDDIASVLSDHIDIQSRAEVRKSAEYLAAEDQVRRFFALHAGIYSLCGEILPRMGRDRFIATFRRLLKSYYKSQLKLAKTNIERSTIFLLRSRFHRERISTSIADRLDPKEDVRLEAEKNLEGINDRTAKVQEWLMKQRAFTVNGDRDEEDAIAPSPDDSDDDETVETHTDEHQDFPHISKMKTFLSRSTAFRELIIELHLLLMPSQFQSLARTLLAMPSEVITIMRGYRATASNNFKVMVEDAMRVEWNWWPLQQSIRPPVAGHTRIAWKCHCRRDLWQDVPDPHVEHFWKLLALKGGQTFGTHLCAQRFAEPQGIQYLGERANDFASLPFTTALTSHTSGVGQTTAAQSRKGAAQASLSRSSSSSGSLSTSAPTVLSSGSQAPSSATSIATPASSVTIPSADRFILFSISGKRRTLDLVHINTVKDTNDDLKLFEMLLKSYGSVRGKLRRWLSVWQLHHCDFVKFKKIMNDRVVSMGPDLPSCYIDYSYDPRPPDPLAPAIDKHMWELALLRPCNRTLLGVRLPICPLSWFHDCIQPHSAGSLLFLPAIPKKHTEWLLKTPDIDYAWGIVAKEEPYLIILVIYHFLMFAGPFGFWAWWLAQGEGGAWDLQDAAVPTTMVGVLVSLFWSAAQPLGFFDSR